VTILLVIRSAREIVRGVLRFARRQRALTTIVLGSVACSGKVGNGGTAAGAGPDAGHVPGSPADASLDAPSMANCHGTQLVVSTSVMVSTPDPRPFNPSLAASPSGDEFLVAWINVPIPGAIWSATVTPSPGGMVSSAATQGVGTSSCNPVAAWGGNGFAVAWGNGTELMLQQLDTTGATAGGPVHVSSRPSSDACPSGLVMSSGGLVLEWTEGPSGQSKNYAALLGADGTAQSLVLLDSTGDGSVASLAALSGTAYAAYTQIGTDNASTVFVSAVQEASPLVATNVAQGNLRGFFSAPPNLAALMAYGSTTTLYESAGAAGFQSLGQVDHNVFTASANACGRVVGLATSGQTAGTAGATGPIFAEVLGGSGPQRVVVANDYGEAMLVGAGATFGVVWVEGGGIGPGGRTTLRFATLALK
jgi:hypothetical protein